MDRRCTKNFKSKTPPQLELKLRNWFLRQVTSLNFSSDPSNLARETLRQIHASYEDKCVSLLKRL